jgi:DtxR family transcriptional regulator, Mn-dependent transcriptional regulator
MSARRQKNGNSESVDNYLKAILALSGSEQRRVTSKSLSDRLGVAPASVTNMLQKLASAASPLVEYERHRGVLLSPAGRRRALEVLRHHRLIETFLYEILDYPIEEVHDEAERLEHFISERFEERIAAKLGHPRIDPHGHSIPTMEGVMSSESTMLLADVAKAGTFIIDSVSDRSGPTLRLLKASGITPGATLRVDRNASAVGYTVKVGRSSKPVDLSLEEARDIRLVAATK